MPRASLYGLPNEFGNVLRIAARYLIEFWCSYQVKADKLSSGKGWQKGYRTIYHLPKGNSKGQHGVGDV